MKLLVTLLVAVTITTKLGQCQLRSSRQNFFRDNDSPEDLFDDSPENPFLRTNTGRFRNSRESPESLENFRGRTSNSFGSTRRFQDSLESRENILGNRRTFPNNFRATSRFDDSRESRESRENNLGGIGFRRFNSATPSNTFPRRRFGESRESRENSFGINQAFNRQTVSAPRPNPFTSPRRFVDSIESEENRFNVNRRFQSRTNTLSAPRTNTLSARRPNTVSAPRTNTFSAQRTNTFNNRIDDSHESNERRFGGNRRFQNSFRSNRNRFGDSRSSEERVLINTPATVRQNPFLSRNAFNRRDSIEDSFEIGTRRNFQSNAVRNTFGTTVRQRFDDSPEDFVRNRNTITRGFDNSAQRNLGRNHFRSAVANKLARIDSPEDIFDDLFDDDADDRIRAQNALKQLNNNHFSVAQHKTQPTPSHFSNRGFANTRRFGRPLPTFNSNSKKPSNNNAGSFHFATAVGSNRNNQNINRQPVAAKKPSSAFQFTNRVGSSRARRPVPTTPNKIQSSGFNKIRTNPFSTTKSSGVTGFKWPESGVSGYYVSMSTNNQPATSYFVQLDD